MALNKKLIDDYNKCLDMLLKYAPQRKVSERASICLSYWQGVEAQIQDTYNYVYNENIHFHIDSEKLKTYEKQIEG
jgi:hypothetical protein